MDEKNITPPSPSPSDQKPWTHSFHHPPCWRKSYSNLLTTVFRQYIRPAEGFCKIYIKRYFTLRKKNISSLETLLMWVNFILSLWACHGWKKCLEKGENFWLASWGERLIQGRHFWRELSTPRPWNTGLVSIGGSLTSWREGASLALVGSPSSDSVTIKMPYGVDVLHRPASHPIFSYWVG